MLNNVIVLRTAKNNKNRYAEFKKVMRDFESPSKMVYTSDGFKITLEHVSLSYSVERDEFEVQFLNNTVKDLKYFSHLRKELERIDGIVTWYSIITES